LLRHKCSFCMSAMHVLHVIQKRLCTRRFCANQPLYMVDFIQFAGECSGFVLDTALTKKDNKMRDFVRILGIDPGLRNMGWGIVDVAGSKLRHVANGCLHSGTGELAVRLCALHTQLTDVLARYAPDTAAVEHTFVNKDAAGTLKLGQARAIALLVPAQAGLEVAEYAPNAIKKVVVGVGHADKSQVEHMVKLQLPGVEINGPDASDALAIALAHAHHAQFSGRLAAALKAAEA